MSRDLLWFLALLCYIPLLVSSSGSEKISKDLLWIDNDVPSRNAVSSIFEVDFQDIDLPRPLMPVKSSKPVVVKETSSLSSVFEVDFQDIDPPRPLKAAKSSKPEDKASSLSSVYEVEFQEVTPSVPAKTLKSSTHNKTFLPVTIEPQHEDRRESREATDANAETLRSVPRVPTAMPTVAATLLSPRKFQAMLAIHDNDAFTLDSLVSPTISPTEEPTEAPSDIPTWEPSNEPSREPTREPTAQPSEVPSAEPSRAPSVEPTKEPSREPTNEPTVEPTREPTREPTAQPSEVPSAEPSRAPSVEPTKEPTLQPTVEPTLKPSRYPSAEPSETPSLEPTVEPTKEPSREPSREPSVEPSVEPSMEPTKDPTVIPTLNPTRVPSALPTHFPSSYPSSFPSSHPSSMPTVSVNTSLSRAVVAPNITYISLTARTRSSVSLEVHISYGPATVYCSLVSLLDSARASYPLTSAAIVAQGQAIRVSAASPVASFTASNLLALNNYTVLCTTASSTGQQILSYREALSKSVVVSTACCKRVAVTQRIAATTAGKVVASALSIVLESAPRRHVALAVSYAPTNVTSQSGSSIQVTPATVMYSNSTSTAMLSSVHTLAVSSNALGLYALNVSVVGSSSHEYEVVYSSVSSLRVLGSYEEPPTPVVNTQAFFSSDGSYVQVTFDAATNRAGYTNSFPCVSLFSFVGISRASCKWSDSATVQIFQQFYTTRDSLSIGSSLAFQNTQNALKATCTHSNTTLCRSWTPVNSSSNITIHAPASALSPIVQLSVPPSVAVCQSLKIDLTSSSGAAGRPWQRVLVSATVVGQRSEVTAALNSVLARNLSVNSPILSFTVPAALLVPKDSQFAFVATLCNFLGACTSTSTAKLVNVRGASSQQIPTITWIGTSDVTQYTSQSLQLQVDASVTTCSGNNVTSTSTNLVYNWSIALQSYTGAALTAAQQVTLAQQTQRLRSIATSSRIFRLSSFSLVAPATYLVTLRVSVLNAVSTSSSVVTAPVRVLQGALVPVIRGGLDRVVMVDAVSVLDAASSYDADRGDQVTGRSAGLSFQWSCLQTQPTFRTDCRSLLQVLDSSESKARWSFQAWSNASSSNASVIVTVLVSDGYTRSVPASIALRFSNRPVSQLRITTAPSALTNIATQQRFTLSSSLQLVSASACSWAVDDTSIDLSSSAVTPVSKTFSASSNQIFNLVLAAQSLPQRASLTFSLVCVDSTVSAATARVSTTVTTNGAPLPGRFRITPSTGQELSTQFTFDALDWSDTDLPISYSFAVQSASSSSVYLAMTSRSGTGSVARSLAAGSARNNRLVSCALEVFDALDASIIVYQSVEVTSLAASAQLAQLSLLTQQQSSASPDEAKALLSVASSVLNTVNCSSALTPNCSLLHRADCASTSFTCGSCLSGYLGTAGDANDVCLSTSSMSRSSGMWGQSCAVDSDCGADYLVCVGSELTCRFQAKRCPLDCSASVSTSRGNCTYQSISTGQSLTTVCRLDDASCEAVCQCATGYLGTGCETTAAELSVARDLRNQLANTMASLVESDEKSAVSVQAWSGYLAAIASQPLELSTRAGRVLQRSALSTLNAAQSLASSGSQQVDPSSVLGVLTALNAVQTSRTIQRRQQQQRRRLHEVALTATAETDDGADTSDRDEDLVASASSMLSTASAYAQLVAVSTVVGESPSDYLYDNFRLCSSTQLWTNNSTNSSDASATMAQVDVPRSSLEALSDAAQSSLALYADSTSDTTFSTVLASSLRRQRRRRLQSTSADDDGGDVDTNSEETTTYTVNVLQTLQRAYTSSVSSFYSDPVRLQLIFSADDASSNSSDYAIVGRIALRLRHNDAYSAFLETYHNLSDTSGLTPDNVTTTCALGDTETYVVTCPLSQIAVSHVCPGDVAGVWTTQCPHWQPSCAALFLNATSTSNGVNVSSLDNCQVTNVTAVYTTCVCNFEDSSSVTTSVSTMRTARESNRRSLSTSSPTVSSTTSSTTSMTWTLGTEQDLVAAPVYLFGDRAHSFLQSVESAASTTDSYQPLLGLFAVIWGCGFFLCCIQGYAGYYTAHMAAYAKKKKAEEDENKGVKGGDELDQLVMGGEKGSDLLQILDVDRHNKDYDVEAEESRLREEHHKRAITSYYTTTTTASSLNPLPSSTSIVPVTSAASPAYLSAVSHVHEIMHSLLPPLLACPPSASIFPTALTPAVSLAHRIGYAFARQHRYLRIVCGYIDHAQAPSAYVSSSDSTSSSTTSDEDPLANGHLGARMWRNIVATWQVMTLQTLLCGLHAAFLYALRGSEHHDYPRHAHSILTQDNVHAAILSACVLVLVKTPLDDAFRLLLQHTSLLFAGCWPFCASPSSASSLYAVGGGQKRKKHRSAPSTHVVPSSFDREEDDVEVMGEIEDDDDDRSLGSHGSRNHHDTNRSRVRIKSSKGNFNADFLINEAEEEVLWRALCRDILKHHQATLRSSAEEARAFAQIWDLQKLGRSGFQPLSTNLDSQHTQSLDIAGYLHYEDANASEGRQGTSLEAQELEEYVVSEAMQERCVAERRRMLRAYMKIRETFHLQSTTRANRSLMLQWLKDQSTRETSSSGTATLSSLAMHVLQTAAMSSTSSPASSIFLFLFALLLIVALNAVSLYLVFSFALRTSSSSTWTQDFVVGAVVHLAVDIGLLESLEVLWIHVLVPLLVRVEVLKAFCQVQEVFAQNYQQQLQLPLQSGTTSASTARYFDLSYQLAIQRPALTLSPCLLTQSTPLRPTRTSSNTSSLAVRGAQGGVREGVLAGLMYGYQLCLPSSTASTYVSSSFTSWLFVRGLWTTWAAIIALVALRCTSVSSTDDQSGFFTLLAILLCLALYLVGDVLCRSIYEVHRASEATIATELMPQWSAQSQLLQQQIVKNTQATKHNDALNILDDKISFYDNNDNRPRLQQYYEAVREEVDEEAQEEVHEEKVDERDAVADEAVSEVVRQKPLPISTPSNTSSNTASNTAAITTVHTQAEKEAVPKEESKAVPPPMTATATATTLPTQSLVLLTAPDDLEEMMHEADEDEDDDEDEDVKNYIKNYYRDEDEDEDAAAEAEEVFEAEEASVRIQIDSRDEAEAIGRVYDPSSTTNTTSLFERRVHTSPTQPPPQSQLPPRSRLSSTSPLAKIPANASATNSPSRSPQARTIYQTGAFSPRSNPLTHPHALHSNNSSSNSLRRALHPPNAVRFSDDDTNYHQVSPQGSPARPATLYNQALNASFHVHNSSHNNSFTSPSPLRPSTAPSTAPTPASHHPPRSYPMSPSSPPPAFVFGTERSRPQSQPQQEQSDRMYDDEDEDEGNV